MRKDNLFEGESYYALFAQIIYKWLISRKWTTYADIMAEHLGFKSAQKLPYNISNCDNYGELKKAFRDIRNAIKAKVGEDCIEEEGNNRSRRFRYVGKDTDPLGDMRNAKVVNNLKQYWQFCQDSAGFFPQSWLEYFFRDCKDLISIKKKRQSGEQMISASLDSNTTNINLLPILYVAITNKQVLEIDYQPFDKEKVTLTFHPHFLKEFNGRWFLFGHAEGKEPEFGYNIALDRITSYPREKSSHKYIQAPPMFYSQFFNDIIGVSQDKDAPTVEIIIRAHSNYIFNLINTKPIHHSYNALKSYGNHDDGEYGEFSITIKPNNEFYGRILLYGSGLEIISPESIRQEFKNRLKALTVRYFS